jgi:hypothetical protein
VERVASQKPANGEIETSHYAMSLKRFNGICRTARVIPATGRKQRRNSDLVSTNEQNKNGTHDSACETGCPVTDLSDISSQFIKRRLVRLGFRPNQYIDTTKIRQQSSSYQLAQPAFDAVSGDDLVSMLGHYYANPWMQKQRS